MSKNKIEVKKLNLEGLKFLKTLCKENYGKTNNLLDLTQEILNNQQYLECISNKVEIEAHKDFASRFELAKYLHSQFKDLIEEDDLNDQGLWAWLTLIYFKKISRQDSDLLRMEHYIPIYSGSSSLNKIKPWFETRGSLEYRHCIKGPYDMYEFLGEKSKFLTSKQGADRMGDAMETFGSRLFLRRHKIILEAMHDIFSGDDGYIKKGVLKTENPQIDSNSLGFTRRSCLVTDGLLYTHNFNKINNYSELVEIMGEEFEDSA